MGYPSLERIISSKPAMPFPQYVNPKWTQIIREIQEAYRADSNKGLRKFVVRERCRIYENDLQDIEEFNLMIMDVYDLILNMVTFKDWQRENLHEEDFGYYWKSVFDVVFRGTSISMVRGEACCSATKYERQVNEYEYGNVSTGINGRKIGLIFQGSIFDDKNVKKNIELGSVEIKPANVSEDVEAIQLNKNIRVNKSILHNIVTHMGENEDDCYVLGIDIIGLSALIHSVHQYEDVIVASKVEEDNLFLPGDVDDLEDLVFGNTLDQLLNFKEFILNLQNDINKASKKYKRLRISSKTSGSVNPRLQSPPRRENAFPESTFYTPKRE